MNALNIKSQQLHQVHSLTALAACVCASIAAKLSSAVRTLGLGYQTKSANAQTAFIGFGLRTCTPSGMPWSQANREQFLRGSFV